MFCRERAKVGRLIGALTTAFEGGPAALLSPISEGKRGGVDS